MQIKELCLGKILRFTLGKIGVWRNYLKTRYRWAQRNNRDNNSKNNKKKAVHIYKSSRSKNVDSNQPTKAQQNYLN